MSPATEVDRPLATIHPCSNSQYGMVGGFFSCERGPWTVVGRKNRAAQGDGRQEVIRASSDHFTGPLERSRAGLMPRGTFGDQGIDSTPLWTRVRLPEMRQLRIAKRR